jgi:hypothetical protein
MLFRSAGICFVFQNVMQEVHLTFKANKMWLFDNINYILPSKLLPGVPLDESSKNGLVLCLPIQLHSIPVAI